MKRTPSQWLTHHLKNKNKQTKPYNHEQITEESHMIISLNTEKGIIKTKSVPIKSLYNDPKGEHP